MKSHKLSTIVYAQGFLEDEINSSYAEIAGEENAQHAGENEYRENVRHMWAIVNAALDELRKENTSLENKLALIDLARNTQT